MSIYRLLATTVEKSASMASKMAQADKGDSFGVGGCKLQAERWHMSSKKLVVGVLCLVQASPIESVYVDSLIGRRLARVWLIGWQVGFLS